MLKTTKIELMTTQKTDLNLARKWRPQNFDHIIGQDVSMRMLKNGLYLKKFFPVYLFAGQRGCGKTSTARVFATAINCERLTEFQQTPTISLPCLACTSCTAMINGNHPDFIEIDAASHTGVDNVRSIIESSSYMPLMGKKKIYLIDEAHMLSKAAFNAFLKILEEPPMSVLFILATTETNKIPATVLSRCFQLAFNPINTPALKTHLQELCQKEGVNIQDEALDLIIDETEGSARDAINLLERVRFSDTTVTAESVLLVLGKISVTEIIELFAIIIAHNPNGLLEKLALIGFENRSANILWDMSVQLCRILIWVKYGVSTLPNTWTKHRDTLTAMATQCSIDRLQAIMHQLWSHEELFLRTSKKHVILEMVLLEMCQNPSTQPHRPSVKLRAQELPSGRTDFSSPTHPDRGTSDVRSEWRDKSPDQTSKEPPLKIFSQQFQSSPPPQAQPQRQEPQAALPPSLTNQPTTPTNQAQPLSEKSPWIAFQQAVTNLGDLLLNSIILQTRASAEQTDQTLFKVQLSSDSPFFKNKLEESKPQWLPLLHNTIGTGYQGFAYEIALQKPPPPQNTIPRQPISAAPEPIRQGPSSERAVLSKPKGPATSSFSITDPAQWPKASLILKHFPGKIRKIDGS